MRSITLLALATSALFPGAVAEAQSRHDGPSRRDWRDRGPVRDERLQDRPLDHRRWKKGDRFDPRYAQAYGKIDFRRHRGLRPPYRGYRHVRSGNDAILVASAIGIVAAVVTNAIH